MILKDEQIAHFAAIVQSPSDGIDKAIMAWPKVRSLAQELQLARKVIDSLEPQTHMAEFFDAMKAYKSIRAEGGWII